MIKTIMSSRAYMKDLKNYHPERTRRISWDSSS